MTTRAQVLAAVVMPFRDESAILSGTLRHLASTCQSSGTSPGEIALVGVDNGSTDNGAEVFMASAQACGFGASRVEHSGGAVVSARALGFDSALSHHSDARLIVSLDADTAPGPAWLREALTLWSDGADAVSFIGTFPYSFWRLVPALTARYAAELGTVFFDPRTSSRAGRLSTGFHQDMFDRLGRTLVDQLFAIRPEAYERAGGHQVQLDQSGAEVLHEGGRLAYQLSLIGANIVTARVDRYTTSPRRLVGEASDLFSGVSYAGEMRIYRAQDNNGLEALDASSGELDFSSLRRYVVRNYVVFQLLCRPQGLSALRFWLPDALVSRLEPRIREVRAGVKDGFEAVSASVALDRELGGDIEQMWRATEQSDGAC